MRRRRRRRRIAINKQKRYAGRVEESNRNKQLGW
jgi:hypothetical protein